MLLRAQTSLQALVVAKLQKGFALISHPWAVEVGGQVLR
jgi:hypothetical protein